MRTINCDDQLVINANAYDDADNPIFIQDHFEGPQLTMFHTVHRGTELFKTYSVGGWEAGAFHRKVNEGPLVEGPHAWMSENAVALTAHKQEKRPEILVEPGDHLIIRGTEYEIVAGRWDLKLEPVA